MGVSRNFEHPYRTDLVREYDQNEYLAATCIMEIGACM
jgi:hypothetical protein